MKKSLFLTTSLDNLDSILNIPFLDSKTLDSLSKKEIYEICKTFFDHWKKFLIDEYELPKGAYSVFKQVGLEEQIDDREALWDHVFLKVVSIYNCAVRKYIELDFEDQEAYIPGLAINVVGDFLTDPISLEKIPENKLPFYIKQFETRIFSHFYLSALLSLRLIEIFKLMLPVPFSPATEPESQLHYYLLNLFRVVGKMQSQPYREVGYQLIETVLCYSEKVYKKLNVYNLEHRPSNFSAMKLHELSLLARRDSSIIKRYGENHVAKIFEHQLALIIQSMGLYVIATKTGNSTVDLICVSNSPDKKVTILVEAKTSRRNYYLPKKDARALEDYVADVQKTLASFPDLSFVLITGPKPASGLDQKLVSLQARIGIPVRYCDAQLIANLREELAGLLPVGIFVKTVLESTSILSPALVSEIASAFQKEQKAHRTFVENMLSAKGVI